MQNLRIPGPTPCPPETLGELSKQMINHRGPEFAEMQGRIMERLKLFFRTSNEVYVYTTSGTGAMEAVIVNTLSVGDRVLSVSIGEFGDRFGDIADAFGAEVVRLNFEPGTQADPQAIADALDADPSIEAVLVTHNETSTGVTNDIAAISKAIRAVKPEVLLIVDAISSLGCIPFATDAWQVDVATTASQKGFMIPPGLAFVTMSPRAWAAYERSDMRKYYFDIGKCKRYAAIGQTPFTPAVSLYYGLDLALDMMYREGLEQTNARHHDVADYTRGRVRALGLKLLADGPQASDTVTSVVVPEGVDAKQLFAKLNSEHDTVLASGQGKLAGKIVRIGHMGIVDKKDIDSAIEALDTVLGQLGYKKPAAVG
ncbi:MAG TPA: alanine--glyoxylate aminotransferase family protein [Dehalococcoidia bacterium]|nr:alanine--glyoxylate aminotransferase family protein [Dehalococcoidia bacterium]